MAAGGWLLLNPTPADQSAYVTLTGTQNITNKTFTTGNAFNGTLGATTPAAISNVAVAGTACSAQTLFGATSSSTGARSNAPAVSRHRR